MTEKKIERALTEQEWRLLTSWLAGKMPGGKVRGMVVMDLPDEHRAGAIAVANAMLEDDDRRKITREWITTIRDNAYWMIGANDSPAGKERNNKASADLVAIADALESYLPPESV